MDAIAAEMSKAVDCARKKCDCETCRAHVSDCGDNDRDREACDLAPGEPTQQILDLMSQLDPNAGRGIICPGLAGETEPCSAAEDAKQRRVQLVEVLRELETDDEQPGEVLPEPLEEIQSERIVNRGQRIALRYSSSALEHTAAQLEEAQLYEEADLVRRLADDLRDQARQAAAAARGAVFVTSAPPLD